jgi:hypothetical protein
LAGTAASLSSIAFPDTALRLKRSVEATVMTAAAITEFLAAWLAGRRFMRTTSLCALGVLLMKSARLSPGGEAVRVAHIVLLAAAAAALARDRAAGGPADPVAQRRPRPLGARAAAAAGRAARPCDRGLGPTPSPPARGDGGAADACLGDAATGTG